MAKQKSVLAEHIRKRLVEKNENYMMVFVGKPGSGKSYGAIEFASNVDPTFKVRERLVFTAEDFMKVINSDLPPGSAIIWDECGVDLDNRSWYSVLNKMVSWVLQTFRHKNYLVIFTIPQKQFVDSKERDLFYTQVEMVTKKGKSYSVGKWLNIKKDQRTNKTYYYYPQIKLKERVVKVKRVRFSMIHKATAKAYERMKQDFTAELNRKTEEKLNEIKMKEQEKKMTKRDMVALIKKEPEKFKNEKGNWESALIQYHLDIGRLMSENIVKILKKTAKS